MGSDKLYTKIEDTLFTCNTKKIVDITSRHGNGLACSCTFHCDTGGLEDKGIYHCSKCGGTPKFGHLQDEINRINLKLREI